MSEAEVFARRYCAEREFSYLSHEVYATMTSREIWISGEDGSGRFEITGIPFPETNGLRGEGKPG